MTIGRRVALRCPKCGAEVAEPCRGLRKHVEHRERKIVVGEHYDEKLEKHPRVWALPNGEFFVELLDAKFNVIATLHGRAVC